MLTDERVSMQEYDSGGENVTKLEEKFISKSADGGFVDVQEKVREAEQ